MSSVKTVFRQHEISSLNAIIVKLSNVTAMITVVTGKIIHGVVVLKRSYYSRSGW